MRAGKEVDRLRGNGGTPCAPGQAKAAGMQPEEPGLLGVRKAQSTADSQDRNPIRQNRRAFPPNIIGERAGTDGATHREETPDPEHAGGIQGLEAHIDGKGQLMQRHKEAA